MRYCCFLRALRCKLPIRKTTTRTARGLNCWTFRLTWCVSNPREGNIQTHGAFTVECYTAAHAEQDFITTSRSRSMPPHHSRQQSVKCSWVRQVVRPMAFSVILYRHPLLLTKRLSGCSLQTRIHRHSRTVPLSLPQTSCSQVDLQGLPQWGLMDHLVCSIQNEAVQHKLFIEVSLTLAWLLILTDASSVSDIGKSRISGVEGCWMYSLIQGVNIQNFHHCITGVYRWGVSVKRGSTINKMQQQLQNTSTLTKSYFVVQLLFLPTHSAKWIKTYTQNLWSDNIQKELKTYHSHMAELTDKEGCLQCGGQVSIP